MKNEKTHFSFTTKTLRLETVHSCLNGTKMYKYMIRQPIYGYFNVGHYIYIPCFLWAALHTVGLE